MQVRQLIDILSGMQPSDHIAVRFYDRWEFEGNLEEDLSDKSWEIICEEFEQDDNIDQMNKDFLESLCYEYQEKIVCTQCEKVNCTCD